MQLIFLVETNKQTKSDNSYIKSIIDYHYHLDGNKITFIEMNGKANFQKKESEIERLSNRYNGETFVIYCLDLDYSPNPFDNNYTLNLNKQIECFAKNKNRELIWFNEDIEDVMLGRKIPRKDKKREAIIFASKMKYKEVSIESLSNRDFLRIRHTSNLLLVIDQFLRRKNI